MFVVSLYDSHQTLMTKANPRATTPVSDSAREVHLGIKKVRVYGQEATMPVGVGACICVYMVKKPPKPWACAWVWLE